MYEAHGIALERDSNGERHGKVHLNLRAYFVVKIFPDIITHSYSYTECVSAEAAAAIAPQLHILQETDETSQASKAVLSFKVANFNLTNDTRRYRPTYRAFITEIQMVCCRCNVDIENYVWACVAAE